MTVAISGRKYAADRRGVGRDVGAIARYMASIGMVMAQESDCYRAGKSPRKS